MALLSAGITYPTPEPTPTLSFTQTEQVEVKDPEETYPGEECNCYKYSSNRVANLPRMAEIFPNSNPKVGAVAIEFFGKVKHVSIVTSVTSEGVAVIESNYNHCQKGERFIPFTKSTLVGFWSN
jgi:hypothetical protein